MSVNPQYVRDLYREKALERAMELTARNRVSDPNAVLEIAEKFRAFLAGETTEEPALKVKVPYGFKLPREGDGYQYFLFGDSILYRSETGAGSLAKGYVSRLSTRVDRNWKNVAQNSSLATRQQLRQADGYNAISAAGATAVIIKHMHGAWFE